MEVCYNVLSGSLSIVPDQNTDPLTPGSKETNALCFLIFDGVDLTEVGLKDWLRLCAKQVSISMILPFSNVVHTKALVSVYYAMLGMCIKA